jgi:outer membrane cobalamin receptor
MYKKFLVLSLLTTLIKADNYNFDLMDDIFNLDLEQLQNIKVISASKTSQNLNTTPAKMIVITKEQIEQRGYRSLNELLNDLPSIQILNHADSGIMNQIGIRGIMGNNYFKVLQDGIEINQTDGEIMSVSMQYPLFGIERVEILYGAASVLYGADAMSGVINLISSTKENGQVGVWAGERGYKYLYATQALKLNEGLFSYKTHLHTDQNYNFDKHYKNDYWGNESHDFQPQETKSASLRYEKDGFDTGINYRYFSESTLISMNRQNSLSNIFDENANLNSELFSTFIRYKSKIFNDIESTTTLSYESTELLKDSYFKNRYTAYKPGYKYSKSQRYALEETLNKTYEKHNLTFGTSIEFFKSIPMTYDLPTKSLSNVFINGSSNEIKAPIFEEEWNNIAFYLQDQITLNDDFQLSIATRYDKNSSYESSFNPRLALIYSKDSLTQKLIYSQAFLAPSNYNKYKIYGTPLKTNILGDGNKYQTDTFRVANPDLKPEKSKSYEYNFEYLLDKNHLVSFSTYYTTIKDLILIEEKMPEQTYFIPNTTILDPRGAKNAANSYIYGGDISYNGHSYFSGYDLNYWLNYAYVNGKINYDYDYKIPFFTSHIFKAGSTFRYKDFTISPSLRWLGPITASHYKDGKLSRVDGYLISDLYSSYSVDKMQKISLKIDNLFDKHYYGVRYNTSSKYVTPQNTRMISLAYTINF